ncbi:SigmaK-factor processing regulatory protein BofA [compost metagenome]
MKGIWIGTLVISMVMLLYILISRRVGFAWLTKFTLHIVLAALGLYVVNYSGILADIYIPLNPVTLSTVFILGLPGVGLLYALKIMLI